MLKVFIVNGFIHLGGVVFLETFYNTEKHRLFGYSYANLYGYPMYIILLILNGKFYGPVAEKAYKVQLSTTNKSGSSVAGNGFSSAVQSAAETIYMILFYIAAAVFAFFLYTIPHIGIPLSFVMNCAIMSYYCFEYKWSYLGWNMEQCLSYLERHWAFFLGFGVPGTILTFFLSVIRSGVIFALIYPSYIIMATMATPQPTGSFGVSVESGDAARSEWNLPNTLPIFYPVRKIVDAIILGVRLIGGIPADTKATKKASVAKID
ncbi:etoposide-induced protein 2.4-domain-containing protein [Phycomyces nitens]|nr:etoposide-induced protein 2.4-domain-containing protein [Phycomyces nitens]